MMHQTLASLPIALAVIGVIALHFSVLGWGAARAIGYRAPASLTQLVAVGGLGSVVTGYELLLLGHLNCLTRASIYCSTLIVGLLLVLLLRRRGYA